ncbi:MAG: hypothetical protein QNJ63_31730 [Calothrix sp. MO_192.B10]|nr:hypothetical protein [Calothrix sp. MO_192.B10]
MSARTSRYFEKGHKDRFTTDREVSLSSVLTLRVTPEMKEKIKVVPDWQERLRTFVNTMIEEKHGD